MSADVLRRRLADTLEVVSSSRPDEWIPMSSAPGIKNTPLSHDKIVAFTVNALNYHRDQFGYDFPDPQKKLLEDLRDLTPSEIGFLSDIYHQAQISNDLSVSLSCSDQVAIATHEAKIISNHGLLGKAAVGFLRLID